MKRSFLFAIVLFFAFTFPRESRAEFFFPCTQWFTATASGVCTQCISSGMSYVLFDCSGVDLFEWRPNLTINLNIWLDRVRFGCLLPWNFTILLWIKPCAGQVFWVPPGMWI